MAAKYRLERFHEEHVRVTLTTWGRARECLAAMAVGLPVGALGVGVFFLADVLRVLRDRPEGLGTMLGWMALLLAVGVVGYGLRKATRVMHWDVDGRRGRVVLQLRALTGGEGQRFEATLDQIEGVRLEPPPPSAPRRAVIAIQGAPELDLARAWWGEADALAEVADAVRQAAGLAPASHDGDAATE